MIYNYEKMRRLCVWLARTDSEHQCVQTYIKEDNPPMRRHSIRLQNYKFTNFFAKLQKLLSA